MYDTFSQNWKYFGDEQSVVVKKHWGIRELTHLRVGSSSLVVLLVHGYYQRPAISLAPSNFLFNFLFLGSRLLGYVGSNLCKLSVYDFKNTACVVKNYDTN